MTLGARNLADLTKFNFDIQALDKAQISQALNLIIKLTDDHISYEERLLSIKVVAMRALKDLNTLNLSVTPDRSLSGSISGSMGPIPCEVPTSPLEQLTETCTVCGKAIDFRHREVYKKDNKYVCLEHA